MQSTKSLHLAVFGLFLFITPMNAAQSLLFNDVLVIHRFIFIVDMNEVEHYRLHHDLVEHLLDFHGNNLHNN